MLSLPFKTQYPPKVTQEYGDKSNVVWYKKNGVDIPFHNGCDFTYGTAKQTNGTPIVCPFISATVEKITWNGVNATKGNGVTIQGEHLGKLYQVVFWHTNEVKVHLGDTLRLGDIVCYTGNSGLVSPVPTPLQPWNGSHCHLMVFPLTMVYKSNGSYPVLREPNNGVGGAVDPRELFDYTQWFKVSDETSAQERIDVVEHKLWSVKDYLTVLNPIGIVKYLKEVIGL